MELRTYMLMSCHVSDDDARRIHFVKQGEDKSLNVLVRLCSTFDARRDPVSLGFFPPALTS